jgi:carboxypeptidase Q
VRRPLLALALATFTAGTLAAQQFGQQSGFVVENPVLRRIWSLGMDSSQTQRYAQVLLDSLGPRLTGTPGMDAAQNWIVGVYQQLGITARRERYGTWRGWRRGITHVDLVQPRVRSLEATMLAWSPGTGNRPVRGPVVVLPEVADSTAFAAWLRDVRGKFVMISYPQPTCRPDSSWIEHDTREAVDRMRAERQAAQQAWAERVRRTGYSAGGTQASPLSRRIEEAGAAGILTSNWTGGWGVGRVFGTNTQRAVALDVACEDYGLLFRLAANGQGPVIEVEADAQPLGEVPVFNVIGEIRGSELPNEYVVLSAHFDSWDGASGATDNGTGTVTMLEAMRILRAAYPNPRRTIVVGHWSGEEQGLIGSRAFAADHPEIVAGLQALFNQDNGTGRIVNVSAAGLVNATANLARWLSYLPVDLTRDLRFGFTGQAAGGGSDNASFACYGAPAFGLGSQGYDYGTYTWHTGRDTYDKISFASVRMNATMTAMLAYMASEDPTRVPRERRDVFGRGQGGQAGGWPACVTPARSYAESLRPQ